MEEQEQGAAAARNKGLLHSSGGYVYFFDIDDDLFPDALRTLQNVLDANDAIDSVYGKSVKSRTRIALLELDEEESLQVQTFERPHLGIRWMDYGTLPGTPSFLHRKRVFEKVGNFNTALKLGEDAAFLVKLGMECTLAFIDKYVMMYYRHPNSTVSKQNQRQPYKEFTYWQPLVLEHIPYYVHHSVPKEFKKKLLLKTYGYLAKMIARTQGYHNRKLLKKQLFAQIKPLTVPILLRPFIWLITVSGSLNVYKAYFFYVLPLYLKSIHS